MNSYKSISRQLGNVRPETRSIAAEVVAAANAAGHDVRYLWGMGSSGVEHPSGLALDFMVYNAAAGKFIRDYLWQHRARLRLRHVIWDQAITSTVKSPGVRRRMADRGSPTENHKDHVHAWFFPGTYRKPSTSKPTSKPSKPSTARPGPSTLSRGSTGPRVSRLQHGLRTVFPAYAGRLAVDRKFGPDTERAVREFQRRAGITVDGRVGPVTTRTLSRYGVRL